MKEFLEKLFSSSFMPHGHCYLWNPGLIWLHVVSDCPVYDLGTGRRRLRPCRETLTHNS